MSDGFKINQDYAERYNNWRRKEELQKLKARYGDVDDSSSSSESDEEDEQEFMEKFDKGWLKAYSALKSNDPSLYKKDVNFYEDEDEETSDNDEEEERDKRKKKLKKEKPMYIKDYERKVLLEKGGIVNEDEEEEGSQSTGQGETLGYYQEQEKLRKSIVEATKKSSDADSDDDDDGLLVRRVKSKEEKEKEESDYLDWLKGQKEEQADGGKEADPGLVPLKEFWNKPDLDDGEKFLRNYILNKEYMDKDSGMQNYDDMMEDEENLSEDEELLTLQDNFERKYNFRFEEPGAAEIQTFPRDMEESMRQKDNKRKERREAVKERKEMEKDKKKEEIKQLKNLKREEIMSKIEQLKKITGNPSLGFDEKDLEEEFDPKKHDEMMAQYFNDGYYDEGEVEDLKPEFDLSDDDVVNWDNWTGEADDVGQEIEGTEGGEASNYDEPHPEDPDFNMDADYDPSMAKDKKKRSRKKGKLAEALLKEKPVFDPGAKSFEEYFDEYYKLDYEDIVGDMPTRFRYRKVLPNNFGLSVDEIIKARDKELNAWVSIKKMSQYRTEEEELRDVRGFTAKGKNERKKRNILTSIFMSDDQREAQVEGEGPSKKNKKRKRREREQRLANLNYNPENTTRGNPFETPSTSNQKEKKGKEKTNKSTKSETVVMQDSDSGKSPKKKGKKGKGSAIDQDLSQDSGIGSEVRTGKHKLEHSEDESDTVKKVKLDDDTVITENVSDTGSSSKKKKKKKHKEDSSESVETLDKSVNEPEGVSNDNPENDNTESSDKVLDKKAKKRLKKKMKKERLREEAKKKEMSDDRLKAYGINPKRYKYMSKQDLFNVQPRQHNKKSSKVNSE